MCLGPAHLSSLGKIRFIKFWVDIQCWVLLPPFHYVAQVELKHYLFPSLWEMSLELHNHMACRKIVIVYH
jgi:hypothetical protein